MFDRNPMLLLITAALLGAACASTPPAPEGGTTGDTPIAPVPFPAETIRGATFAGRTYLFRFEEAGKPAELHRTRFATVDAEGASVVSEVWPADGAPPAEAPPARRVTWAELEGHAHFPRAATTIETDNTVVPAGAFACRRYTVDDGKTVSRFWFAPDLPGAPVRMEVSAGGTIVLTMVLAEHTPGTP